MSQGATDGSAWWLYCLGLGPLAFVDGVLVWCGSFFGIGLVVGWGGGTMFFVSVTLE